MSLSEHWFSDCGGIDNFLRHYWQQKPLLIRQAFPDFESPVSADELGGLALEDEIESRLIIEDQKTALWSLQNGPFDENIFQTLPPSHWTLLVQAVDHWLPEVGELLEHFDFLPRWRLDDIMLSYAEDQGSVGPHFDQYDVFLLQGEGQRRWRVGQVCDASTPLVEGSELKILKHFEQQDEWLLEPGDMLYVPPGVAHWGVAEGECITYSVGFRAPTGVEMLNDLATELLARDDQQTAHVYRDPDFSTMSSVVERQKSSPGFIDKAFIQSAKTLLLKQLDDEQLLGEWFARYMTTRKYPDLELGECGIDDGQESLPLTEDSIITRHPASRFAALLDVKEFDAQLSDTQDQGRQATLAVDGELYPCSAEFATLLANQRVLSINDISPFSDQEKSIFATLLTMGCLVFGNDKVI